MIKLVLLIVALVCVANAFVPLSLVRRTSSTNVRHVSMYAGQNVGSEFDGLTDKVVKKTTAPSAKGKRAAPAPAQKKVAPAPAKKVETTSSQDSVRFEVKLPEDKATSTKAATPAQTKVQTPAKVAPAVKTLSGPGKESVRSQVNTPTEASKESCSSYEGNNFCKAYDRASGPYQSSRCLSRSPHQCRPPRP